MELALETGTIKCPSFLRILLSPLVVLAIAVISGIERLADFMATLQVNEGRQILSGALIQVGSGAGHTVPSFVGWGTGAGTTAAADGSLFTEDYSASNNGTGNTRVSGTASQQTTTTTNDTVQIVATLTAAHTTAVTNMGCFDGNGVSANLTTAPSGANLWVKGDFSTINLSTNDSISATFKCAYA